MSRNRISRVTSIFAGHRSSGRHDSLCTSSVKVLGVAAAGVTLMSGRQSGPVCSSDRRARELDELQFSLGEGPSPDAFATRRPAMAPDLENETRGRWPSFTPPALESGTHGVFAFPLQVGTGCIGVLTLYQDRAGDLTAGQAADVLVVADVIARSMLAIQSRNEPGLLASELTDEEAHRAEVHQATGMVAVQLGVDVSEAALRLRAHAFATARSVSSVARDVVARQLRIGDDGPNRTDG